MERTVPSSGNEEIQLYLRTYYSLLRSSRAVPIKTLIEAHKRINSALHREADTAKFDISAFTYAILRLPEAIERTQLVIMGQSERVFAQHGYHDVETWQQVNASARRRRSFFNQQDTLAVYIASQSDIDDLIPTLAAYQIERRKLYLRLNQPASLKLLDFWRDTPTTPPKEELEVLAKLSDLSRKDLNRLWQLWGSRTGEKLLTIATQKHELSVRSLAGSLADYKRATRRWWRNIERKLPHIAFDERPVYFVSSNIHTQANLLSGYALQIEAALQEFIQTQGAASLRQEYHDILAQQVRSSRENFLYYVLKKYETTYPETIAHRLEYESRAGIVRVPSEHAFDIEMQVVSLNQLDAQMIDGRLSMPGIAALRHSNALILNIDYPLGLAAYQVLTEVARDIDEVRGVYIMGKAATLNGGIGDIMIPNVVHDEHSRNTYLFHNQFTADQVAPYLVYGTVMDNQKAITVPGTFLQNEVHMSIFYREGYTDMEMEAGPYLSGIYEMVRPKRHPYDELVDLHQAPFPIGILHYASDTPFSKGTNLGTQNLSYYGMDPTYAAMVAILRAIIETELRHQGKTV